MWRRLRLDRNGPAHGAKHLCGASWHGQQPDAAETTAFHSQGQECHLPFHGPGPPATWKCLTTNPRLAKFDGTLPPPDLLDGYRAAFIDPNSKLMGPKFKFARHGQSGAELSELLPHMATVADDITIVKSMKTDAFNHAPAQIMMNTGSQQFGKPSLGAWTLYGLGTESQDLTWVRCSLAQGKKGQAAAPRTGVAVFCRPCIRACSFAPPATRYCICSNPPGVDDRLQRDSLDAIRELNAIRLEEKGDPEIATRINSYEVAYRMQASAPELIDVSQEPQHILDMYGVEPGKPSFANNCLLARRMVERGVRFVELFHESWDQHGDLVKQLSKNCLDTEQACAALVKDLKQRGLLEDTLVIWGGEFGRTPMVQGGGNDGRDHHPNVFTMWFAGGGTKPGITLGESDELGFNATKDPVHVRDLHATILHLLGFDHNRLSFPFQGLDQKLTGVVPAKVVEKMLA